MTLRCVVQRPLAFIPSKKGSQKSQTRTQFKIWFNFNFGLQFTDVLMYANRSTQPTLHFKVHGQMALRDLTVLDSEPRLGAEFCFNLYDGKKAVLLSASTYSEKICWMDDIAEAAQVLRSSIACGVKEFHTSKSSSAYQFRNTQGLHLTSRKQYLSPQTAKTFFHQLQVCLCNLIVNYLISLSLPLEMGFLCV